MRTSGAFMDFNQTTRGQRRFDDMLPRVKDHLRFRIPKPDFYGNRHVPNGTDHNNTRPYLGTISDILIGPVFGSLPIRSYRIPYVELVVISEDGQTATMAWLAHDSELIKLTGPAPGVALFSLIQFNLIRRCLLRISHV